MVVNHRPPHGASVNDGINPLFCSLCYTTVDEIAAMVARLGRGTMLAKIDIESAYRLLPVHPQDRILQAIRWDGQLYIDAVLPLGLWSAAKIFSAVADALNWHLKRAGIEFIEHYLNDYIHRGIPQHIAMPRFTDHSGQRMQGPRSSPSSPQVGGPGNMHHFSWNPCRYRGRPIEAADGKATPPTRSPADMERSQIVHKEGAGTVSRPPQPCLQGSAIRQVLLTAHA